ncbi:MAG TPA: hypothetical protein VEH30_18035 [Terriglobales bacterium]|nr:hypothetical protein [Terriglobales bacterium]
MKRVLRVLFLMVGLWCAATALVVPTIAVADEGAPPPFAPPTK